MALFVLMGVSGSGKSTIGQRVAAALAVPFIEGDDYHPTANVRKMSSGTPLTDDDRVLWIEALMRATNARPEANVIVACSALTVFVRDSIKLQSRRFVWFVHLVASPTLIEQRLTQRGEHFMKPGMLPSQLATLQRTDEAIVIDTTPALDEVCETVRAEIEVRLTR